MTRVRIRGGRLALLVAQLLLLLILSLSSLLLCDVRVEARQRQLQRQHQPPPLPYIHDAKCTSTVYRNTGGANHTQRMCCHNHVDIVPGLSFHWTNHKDDGTGLFGALEYSMTQQATSEHWLGFGFSPDGQMINSRAMIGSLNNHVKAFDLISKELPTSGNRGGAVEHNNNGEGQQGLGAHSGQMIAKNGNLTMHFNIENLTAFMPNGSNQNGFINMIYAAGTSKVMGYHEHRGSFRLDITNCPPRPDPSEGQQPATSAEQENDKKAFAVHGFFAILSFLVMMPMALFSAWLRTLIPFFWIYVHVICNVLAAFFLTISTAAAFGGMVLRSKVPSELEQHDHNHTRHMSIAHHWVGLILFFMMLIQVMSGFNRPPLEPFDEDNIDNNSGNKRSCCSGMIPLPSDKREMWHCFHYKTALVIIGMALYQLQSGLWLFTTEYGGNTKTAIIAFWVWAAVIVGMLLLFKWCISCRHKKTQLESNRNIMPQMRAEEEEDYTPHPAYHERTHDSTSQKFPSVSDQEMEMICNLADNAPLRITKYR